MKTTEYIHPSLREVVPVELRKKLYNQLLEDKEKRKIGLCLALPVILWNLNDYVDFIPGTQTYWSFNDSSIAFPELTRDRIRFISDAEWIEDFTTIDEARVQMLNEMIQELS